MNLKKQKRERKKYNALDWILIFLTLAVVLSAGWYVWYRRSAPDEQWEIRCVMRIPAVNRADWEAYAAPAIQSGCTVRSENGTAILGTVQTVAVQEHMEAVLRDGEIIWTSMPELADIELEVRMLGSLSAGRGVRVGDLRIAAGGHGSFRFGGYFAAGTEILSLEVMNP